MIDNTSDGVYLGEAVLNMKPDGLRKLCEKLENPEAPENNDDTEEPERFEDISARALALACRFRGIEIVKTLCGCGAAFEPSPMRQYDLYYEEYDPHMKDGYQPPNHYLLLLNIEKKIQGSDSCYKVEFPRRIKLKNGKTIRQIPDSERAEVLKYLCENREKCRFDPSELLYYSIFVRDELVFGELKELGIKLPDDRVKALTGEDRTLIWYWSEFCSMINKLSDEDFIPVMTRLYGELGNKFRCSKRIFKSMKARFSDAGVIDFFTEKFSMTGAPKKQILCGVIDADDVGLFPLVEKLGWLADARRRDLLIEYAQKNNKPECTAWLLDFKNRTADLASEQAKAERRLNRRLNAAPDSALALRELWNCKKLEDGTLMITSYKGDKTEITIPEKIGRSMVTVIGNYAFSPKRSRLSDKRKKFFKTITKVTIPDTVTSIGEGAFWDCEGLREIEIPYSVTEIKELAFDGCVSLEYVKLPNGLTKITHGLFGGSGLKSIDLPRSVKRIEEHAFDGCAGLREFVFPDTVKSIGSCVLQNCVNLESAKLPGKLSVIPSHLFFGCRSLKEIIIPNTVRKIGMWAFFGCCEFTSVIVPDSVKEIGANAFRDCVNLEYVKLPQNLSEIEAFMFCGCERLKSIDIPANVKSIGGVAFYNCGKLKAVVIPDGTEQIGDSAFSDCCNLERLVLPASVTQIDNELDWESETEKWLCILDGSPNAVAEVVPNSYAEEYCKQNNIPYTYKE